MKALIAATALILTASANAQTTALQTQPVPVTTLLESTRTIVVSLEDRKLALVEDGVTLKTYTVAVGKPSTPSPVGTFSIARRAANPVYTHNGKTIPAGPNNPVGTRWMGLSKTGYGIHGTNEPNSIGKAASHGCIRMSRTDLEEFYKLVSVGDKVEIIGHRNQETAALFAPAALPQQPAAPVVQASVETTTPDSAPAAQTTAAQITASQLTAAQITLATLPIAGSR